MVSNDYIKTKDQLGRPDQAGFFVKKVTNNLNIEDRPLVIYKPTAQNTWIVGTDTNSIVGEWTGTLGGGQLVVGVVAQSGDIVRVLNRNNTHYERFVNDELEDKPNTTGTWDTTNQRLVLADGEQAQGLCYYADVKDITNSTMIVTGDTDNALLYLSSDDGNNFESVTDNTQHGFTNVGQVGKWRIVASGGTVTATEIRIKYNE